MTQLTQFRKDKDDFFKHDPDSPLTRDQRKAFTGLRYFPENPDLVLDVTVEPFSGNDMVVMQTSTGDEREYQRFGRFHFNVDGQEAALTIYGSAGDYFLPFTDSLAGTETYPAGRYLEPEPLGGGRFLVDFNIAYNPYCAYNERWSCPIPPAENRLKVPIRAGEMIFEEHSA